MRLVVRSHDARRARPLIERLEIAGIAATALVGPAARRAAPGGEDLTIIDAEDPALAIAFAQTLRDDGISSLAIVGACAGNAPPPSVAGRLDAWIDLDGASEPVARRLGKAYRDGVASVEADERARTADALGLVCPAVLGDHNRPPSALFVGGPCPAFLAIERSIQHWGGAVGATFTSFSAFDHVHDGRFDALVLHGGDDPSAGLSLISALRRNARLHDLPAYFLAEDEDTRADALRRGADEAMRARFDAEKAALWLTEDIRRARRASAVTRVLETELAAEAEKLGFFESHLAGLAQTHHDKGRPLAIAILEVNPPHGAPANTAWRKGFAEIAMLCSRLTRAADSAAPVDERRVALAFPSTNLEGAEAAMARITKVCECTAFAAGEGGVGPLRLSHRVLELSPGESGAGLLSRALLQRAA
jgi:two-component system cell cycle response regulator PopA